MSPLDNPFAPGAGTPPPELAGREQTIEDAKTSVARFVRGKPDQSMLLYGLRGVGKTVLLNKLAKEFEEMHCITVQVEAQEGRSLPGMLAPGLRSALLKLNRLKGAEEAAKKALGALGSFVKAIKLKFNDIEFGLDWETEDGLANSGDFEFDLEELIQSIGEAAKSKGTAIVVIIDELQFINNGEMASLIRAIHRSNQNNLPFVLFGAGLPQLLGNMGNAKSYAERLFKFVPIGQLDKDETYEALVKPAAEYNVTFTNEALAEIYAQTHGYPYFLQEWGSQAWKAAAASPIGLADVDAATEIALAELDKGFFRVRFDRCTPKEKQYLSAMASLDQSSAPRSGDIAEAMGKEVNSVAPLRQSLIKKGMIYSQSHGDNAFTVPLFAEYMRRTMPFQKNFASGILTS